MWQEFSAFHSCEEDIPSVQEYLEISQEDICWLTRAKKTMSYFMISLTWEHPFSLQIHLPYSTSSLDQQCFLGWLPSCFHNQLLPTEPTYFHLSFGFKRMSNFSLRHKLKFKLLIFQIFPPKIQWKKNFKSRSKSTWNLQKKKNLEETTWKLDTVIHKQRSELDTREKRSTFQERNQFLSIEYFKYLCVLCPFYVINSIV